VPAQHLGEGQDQVGGRGSRRQGAGGADADHHRPGEEHRLSEHGGLSFYPAYAPAEDPQSVDHRGVGVGADQCVGERKPVPGDHHPAQVLQVHLVADSHARGDYPEVPKGLLTPVEQCVTLPVAPVLPLDVGAVGVGGAEAVDLHRVVDDQVHRYERVYRFRVPAGPGDCAAEGGQIHHRRHPGEVLHEDAGRHEGEPGTRLLLGPAGQRDHVRLRDVPGARPPKQVLQQNLDRVGQGSQVDAGAVGQLAQAEDADRSRGGVEIGQRFERVVRHGYLLVWGGANRHLSSNVTDPYLLLRPRFRHRPKNFPPGGISPPARFDYRSDSSA
jgi:hypothetical protein